MTWPTVLGVDGCRGGWVGVRLGDPVPTAYVAPTIAGLVDAAGPGLECVGIDMPIGLPDDGPRAAEGLVRGLARQPSVDGLQHAGEATPTAHRRTPRGRSRSARPPARASASSRGDCGTRSSRSTPGSGAGSAVRVVEVHPETSFAVLLGEPVAEGKKTPEGRQARRTALRDAGIEPPERPRGGVGEDDLLDACAVAWTAGPGGARGGAVAPGGARDVLRRVAGRHLGVIARAGPAGQDQASRSARTASSRPTPRLAARWAKWRASSPRRAGPVGRGRGRGHAGATSPPGRHEPGGLPAPGSCARRSRPPVPGRRRAGAGEATGRRPGGPPRRSCPRAGVAAARTAGWGRRGRPAGWPSPWRPRRPVVPDDEARADRGGAGAGGPREARRGADREEHGAEGRVPARPAVQRQQGGRHQQADRTRRRTSSRRRWSGARGARPRGVRRRLPPPSPRSCGPGRVIATRVATAVDHHDDEREEHRPAVERAGPRAAGLREGAALRGRGSVRRGRGRPGPPGATRSRAGSSSSPTPAVAATRLRASRTSTSRRVPSGRGPHGATGRAGLVSSATHRHSSRTLAPTSGAIAAPTPGPGSAHVVPTAHHRPRHAVPRAGRAGPVAAAAHEVEIVLVEDLHGASARGPTPGRRRRAPGSGR